MKKRYLLTPIVILIVLGLLFLENLNNEVVIEGDNQVIRPEYLEMPDIDEGLISKGGTTICWTKINNNISEMLEDTDLVFYGYIKSWKSFAVGGDSSGISTDYEFIILDILYGDEPEAGFIFRNWGGLVSREEYYSKINIESFKKSFVQESICEEERYLWISYSPDFTYDILPLNKNFIIFCTKVYENENIYYPLSLYRDIFISEPGENSFTRILPEYESDPIGTLTKEEIENQILNAKKSSK